jgi:hypothetical protein
VAFDLNKDPLALYPRQVERESYPLMPELRGVDSGVLRLALDDRAKPDLSADDKDALERRLKALGYV